MAQETLIKACYGISSLCIDESNKDSKALNLLKDNHVIYYDVDISKRVGNKTRIISELRLLQIKYNLGNFYILESTHGYNAFCIDKIPFILLKNIFSDSFFVDKNFVKYGLKRGYFTLRLGEDKKYIGFVENPSSNQKSLIHKIVFSTLWDIPIELNNCDKNRLCDIIRFPSDKNGHHNIESERVEI